MALCVMKRIFHSVGSLYRSSGPICRQIMFYSPSSSRLVEEAKPRYVSRSERLAKSILTPDFKKPTEEVLVPTLAQGTYEDLVVPVTNFFQEEKGFALLPGDIFDVPIRKDVVHRVVRWQLANKRLGNAWAKDRSEVKGGGRKPWRQKGTGRARQGSIRAPHFVGGGVCHGPKPRNFKFTLQRKYVLLGLRIALSARAAEGQISIFEDFILSTHRSKYFRGFAYQKPFRTFLLSDTFPINFNLECASRAFENVTLIPAESLDVYTILKHKHLVMTRDAVDAVVSMIHLPYKKERYFLKYGRQYLRFRMPRLSIKSFIFNSSRDLISS